MSDSTSKDQESIALVEIGAAGTKTDNARGGKSQSVDKHFLHHMSHWGLGFCSLAVVALYSVGLMGEQFRIIPKNCVTTSTGNEWPTDTANYYATTYNARDFHANSWWYLKGEWTLKNMGDGVLCPLAYYDDSYGQCAKHGTCTTGAVYCMNKDGSAVTSAINKIGILHNWKLLLKYRKVWEAALPVMFVMWLVCLVYASCLDHNTTAIDKNAKHAWFAPFKPYVNHMGFDKDRVWKSGGHKEQFWNMVLQLLCSALFLVFVWVQWDSYVRLSNDFMNQKTYDNIFLNNPAGGAYCKSVYVEDTATGFFAAALLFVCFSLLIEIYCLVHIYIKANNGGVFRTWFGCYPSIVENMATNVKKEVRA